MPQDDSQGGSPRRVLPWRLILVMVVVGVSFLVPAALLSPDGKGAISGFAGLIPGFFGAMLGKRWPSFAAALATIAAIAGLMLSAGLVGHLLIASALIIAAGVEAVRFGGRSFVFALYGFLFTLLVPGMPAPAETLPYAAFGVFWGWGAVQLLGATAKAAPPPAPRSFGVGLILFLMIGLAAATAIEHWVDTPYGYWIALFFTFRAVAPQGQTITGTLRFGLGVAIGSLAAIMAAALHFPAHVMTPVAILLALFGLRFLPHPGPWSAAAFTGAVLLAGSLSVQTAVFRIEAALTVVALAGGLALIIGMIWQLILREVGPEDQPNA